MATNMPWLLDSDVLVLSGPWLRGQVAQSVELLHQLDTVRFIDLSAVTLVDSSFMAILLIFVNKSSQRIVLYGLSHRIESLLQLYALTPFFNLGRDASYEHQHESVAYV